MSTAAFVVITLVIIGIGYFLESAQKDARREDLVREMTRFGLELIDAKLWATGGKNNRHFHFEFTARIPGDPTIYEASGLFERNSTDPIIRWVGEDPRRVNARGLPAGTERKPDAEMSLEQQINMEVAARLDRISGTPGAMLEHDLDGSGHIDSAEWDALRAKVRAEVELERGLTAAPPRPPPSDEDEPEPEGTAW